MPTMVPPRAALGLLIAAIGTVPAQALVVDTGPGADVGGGWSLYEQRPPAHAYQRLAGRVTLDAAATITSVQGWMNWDGGGLSFLLLTDFQGLPGAPLYGVNATLPATVLNRPDWRGVGGLDRDLAAGHYWLVFADRPEPGFGAMPAGAPAPLAAYASNPGAPRASIG